jgi:hypothetical protein
MRKDLLKHYEALGLEPGASPEEIKRSYRMLIHRWHPDLFKARSLMQTTAADITKDLNEAYELLIKKKLYRQFPPKAEPKHSAPEPAPGPIPNEARRAYERAASPPPPTEPPPKPKPPKPRPAPAKPKPPPPAKPPAPPKARAARKFHRWPWLALAAAAAGLVAVRWAPPSIPSRAPEFSAPEDNVVAVPRSSPEKIVTSVPLRAQATDATVAQKLPAHAADVEALASRPIVDEVSIAIERPRAFSPQPFDPMTASFARAESLPNAMRPSEWSRIVAEVRRELDTFEVGDPKSRVLAIQGPPDEAGENIFRYGSSVIYFKQGLVTDWTNRWPRLRVRAQESAGFGALDTFGYRSTRAEVIRAQGQPTAMTNHSYFYGTSVIRFDREWVAGWREGDRPLKANGLAAPWLADLNAPRPPAMSDPPRVAPGN